MSSREKIIEQVQSAFSHLSNVKEKRMFGKLAFMVNDKLCIAVGKEEIMCRIDPALQEITKFQTQSETVMMRGREMKGYVRIKNHDLQSESDVQYWINLCLEYNKKIA